MRTLEKGKESMWIVKEVVTLRRRRHRGRVQGKGQRQRQKLTA